VSPLKLFKIPKMLILKTLRLLLHLALPVLLILNIYSEMTNHFDYSPFNETFIRSNLILEKARQLSEVNIEKYAHNGYNEGLPETAEKTMFIIKHFINYVDTIHADLDKTIHNDTQWSLWTEKRRAQHYFFGGKMPKATLIKVKITETHQQLINVLQSIYPLVRWRGRNPDEEIKQLGDEMSLQIDENEAITTGKSSWEAFTFGDMSVAACHAMLSKIQNDARADEIRMLNYLSSKISGCCMCFDKFEPVSVPQKTYLFEGERFTTEIFLNLMSEQAYRGDVAYCVDTTALPIKNSKGIFEATPKELGEKLYTVHITAQQPFNPEIWHYSKTFKYEVIQPFVTCAADKMNTIYIGVENPISVRAAGISSGQMQVSATGCALKSNGVGKFIATATAQGIAKITVTTKDWHKTFSFRVKLPPNPVPMLNLKKSGEIPKTEMQAQNRISLEANDLDIKYAIQSFALVRVPYSDRARPVKTVVKSGVFDAAALELVAAAEVGDWYYFEDIKVICPLNNQVLDIEGMNFVIF
jgi:gliding motility-associated protein GldM